MHVQLDALFLGGVHALDFGHLLHVAHAHGQFVQKRVHAAVAPQAHAHAVFDLADLFHDPCPLLLGGRLGRLAPRGAAHAVVVERLAVDGGGVVIDGEGGQHRLAALEFLWIGHAGHGAFDDHDAAVLGQLADGHGRVAHGAPLEHGAALGRGWLFGAGRGRRIGQGGRGRNQRRGLCLQLGVVPGRRLVGGLGHGGKGKAPLGPHLLHPCLPLAADRQRHGRAHAEDVIDGLGQLFVQMVRAEKAHGDLVRAGQKNPPVFQAPSGVRDPGGQGRALAAQKVRQHGLVAVEVGKKLFAKRRAGDAKRHRQPGKELAQPALQKQVVALGHQLVAKKAHVCLVGAFLIEHALDVHLAAEGRNGFLQKGQQLGLVHGKYASAGRRGRAARGGGVLKYYSMGEEKAQSDADCAPFGRKSRLARRKL